MTFEKLKEAKELDEKMESIKETIEYITSCRDSIERGKVTGVSIESYGENNDKLYMSDDYALQIQLLTAIKDVYLGKLGELVVEFNEL